MPGHEVVQLRSDVLLGLLRRGEGLLPVAQLDRQGQGGRYGYSRGASDLHVLPMHETEHAAARVLL